MATETGVWEAALLVSAVLVAASTIQVGSKVDFIGTADDEPNIATTTKTTKSASVPVVEVHVSVQLPVAKNDSDDDTVEKKKKTADKEEQDDVPIVVGLKGITTEKATDIPVFPGLKLGPEFEAHLPRSSPASLRPLQEEIPILVYQDLASQWHPSTPPTRRVYHPRPAKPHHRYRPSVGVIGHRPPIYVSTPEYRPSIHRNYFPVTRRVPPIVHKIDGKLDFDNN